MSWRDHVCDFRFDLKALPVDFVECLMRFLPTEAESKLMRQYERERRPLDQLAEEDRFMLFFSKIERLTQRMSIITFVGNFSDNVNMLTPVSNHILGFFFFFWRMTIYCELYMNQLYWGCKGGAWTAFPSLTVDVFYGYTVVVDLGWILGFRLLWCWYCARQDHVIIVWQTFSNP